MLSYQLLGVLLGDLYNRVLRDEPTFYERWKP